jgi:hypothetical protein
LETDFRIIVCKGIIKKKQISFSFFLSTLHVGCSRIVEIFSHMLNKYLFLHQSSEWAGLGLRKTAHGLSNPGTAQPTHAFQILTQPTHGLLNLGPAQPTHGLSIYLKIFCVTFG